MYRYNLSDGLAPAEEPAEGTGGTVLLLTSEELSRHPALPGLEGVLHHTPPARDARVCKAETRRDCMSGTVVIPRRGREGDRVALVEGGTPDVTLSTPIADLSSLAMGAIPLREFLAYDRMQLSDPSYADDIQKAIGWSVKPKNYTYF